MADQCEDLRIAYEHARAEVEKYILSAGYSKEKCESLYNLAAQKKDVYIRCLFYNGIRPIPNLWIPACPYPESFKVMEEAGKPITPESLQQQPPTAGKTMIVRIFPDWHTLHHHLGVLRDRVFSREMHKRLHPLI